MGAGKYDILVEQGATFDVTLTLRNYDNSLIDLTGHTFRGKIKETYSSTTVQAEFDFSILSTGVVRVTIPAAETAAIAVPPATNNQRNLVAMIYDIESVDGSGVVYRWLEGTAKISPEVTT